MIGLYFSGSGNTQYACQRFLSLLDEANICQSIEAVDVSILKEENEIILAYPIYYSTLPKIVTDFICDNATLWKGKRIYIIATMGLFSGDGCGCGARLLAAYGAHIIGGTHLQMPDCICDVHILKTTFEKNQQMLHRADQKIGKHVDAFQQGTPKQQGLSKISCFMGWITQRLWFAHKTKKYHDFPHIDESKCVTCGACVALCPMQNLRIEDGVLVHGQSCTLCYRCANHCPRKAITLLGKRVVMQTKITDYDLPSVKLKQK